MYLLRLIIICIIRKGELGKMKKLISAFLAVGMLAFAASAASAATVASVTGGRNGQTGYVTSFSNKSSMPCFRPGDTINFTVSAVTSGNELTVISAKCNDSGGAGALSDSTVQYINQYTLSGSSQPVSYKVRDLEDGIYLVKINDSVGTVATFYYKVGDPSVELIIQSGASAGTPYVAYQHAGGWSVGFVGQVNMSSPDISLADVGATPGFEVTNGSVTKTYGVDGSDLDDFVDDVMGANEITGAWSVTYGMTMYNVPAQNSVTAEAVIDGIVTP